MKRQLSVLATVFLLASSNPAGAIAVDASALPDASQEARARLIMSDLRCLVCQNQSIEISDASLARDLRQIVRERVAAGDDDDQVRAYVVARYGDWVLMRPPFRAATWLLWLGPGVLLAIGGAAIWSSNRQRRQAPDPAPLSAAEQMQLRQLD